LDLGASNAYLLEKINAHIESSAGLSPMETFRWKAALQRISSSHDSATRNGTVLAIEHLSVRESVLAEAAALQKVFSTLPVTLDNWQPYRRDPKAPLWLVGRTPATLSGLPLVLAVRAEVLFHQIKHEFEITDADSSEPLSSRLPNLKAMFTASNALNSIVPRE